MISLFNFMVPSQTTPRTTNKLTIGTMTLITPARTVTLTIGTMTAITPTRTVTPTIGTILTLTIDSNNTNKNKDT